MTTFGLELWSIRNLDETVAGQIRRASDLGYQGVSFNHPTYSVMDTEAVRRELDRTGLEACAVSVNRSMLQRGIEDIVDLYGEIGVSTMTYHSKTNNWTERRVRDMMELLRRRAVELKDVGWDLLFHPNHWDYVPAIDWPVARHVPWIGVTDRLERRGILAGSSFLDQLRLNESRFRKGINILLDHYRARTGIDSPKDICNIRHTVLGRFLALDPELLGLTLDLRYPPIRGFDISEVLDRFGSRTKQIHIGDVRVDEVPRGRWPPYCALGEGDIPYDLLVERAQRAGVEWIDISYDVHDNAEAKRAVEEGAEFGRNADLI